jgi:hypothetical protein
VGRAEAAALLADSRSAPYDRLFDLVEKDPQNAFDLVELAIERGGRCIPFISDAVSYAPEAALPRLADMAVDSFARDPANSVAEDVIAHLSLQSPAALQPHLSRLFETRPNADSYYAEWPWRRAAAGDIGSLLAHIRDPGRHADRQRTLRCILETRDSPNPLDLLAEVGLDADYRPLHAERVFHLRFALEYIDDDTRPDFLRPHHPTWTLPATAGDFRFGGFADGDCSVCGQRLHNLLQMAVVPPGLGVRSRDALQMATCLSCLGWSQDVLFFRHDKDGKPQPVAAPRQAPELPAFPLKEATVALAATPPRWVWQDWAISNSRENLHRIGGAPCWVQSAAYPQCPDCSRLMTSFMQLDSNLPIAGGDGEWLWGSGGIGYVFWCDTCAVSASRWQCT